MDQTPPVGQFENFYSSQTPPWVIDEPPPAVVALADVDRQRYVRSLGRVTRSGALMHVLALSAR